MKKIVAFGASSSKNSINKALALYAASTIKNTELNLIQLEDFEMPIFSVDKEKLHGIPSPAYRFKEFLKNADGIIISFAEHNGAYTAAFKNILDWISRIETIVWYNKPMCLLATSTGKRGAKTVLEIAHARISRENKNPIPVFSLPNFNQQFDEKKGILNHDLKTEFEKVIQEFELQIDRSIQSAL